MKGYKRIKVSSGKTYYMEMSEKEVMARDDMILMATAPVITLICVFICAIAAGLI